jgi:hypothetical protein
MPGAKRSRESSGQGEALARVAIIAGDLLAKPIGWLELLAFSLALELDLGDQQAIQLAAEDVELNLEPSLQWNDQPALCQSAPFGQRPKRSELCARQRRCLSGESAV